MGIPLAAKRGPLAGEILHHGPIRAQLFVKGLAPRCILVPVEALPLGFEKGDEVEVVFRPKEREPVAA
jgi:hypothetical protein